MVERSRTLHFFFVLVRFGFGDSALFAMEKEKKDLDLCFWFGSAECRYRTREGGRREEREEVFGVPVSATKPRDR